MASHTKPAFSNYEDMPESDQTFEEDGREIAWSDRFEGWWDIDDVMGMETLSITVVKLGSGQAAPSHAHEDPIEEVYLILEGKVDIEWTDPDTGTVHVVEGATPGTFAYFPPGIEHRPINNYEESTIQLGFRAMPSELENLQELMRINEDEF